MARRRLVFAMLAFSTGCITTIRAPAKPSSAGEEAFPRLRLVYVGYQSLEPPGFVPRLEDALRHDGIEASVEQASRSLHGWPSDVPGPRMGESTVLVELSRPTRCGTGAAANAMLSMVTLGLVPFLDFDRLVWSLTAYDADGHATRPVTFTIDEHWYFWTPLLSLVPVNRVWRWIDGDRFDHAVHVFPAFVRQAVQEAEQAKSY